MITKKRILSWDVGIKHLAFCKIDETEESFVIDKWINIDLTDSDQLKCCGLLKKKANSKTAEICEAGAKFYCKNKNTMKYYCGTHKSQHTINYDDIEKQYVKDNPNVNEKCTYTSSRSTKGCTKSAKYQVDNNLYCSLHKDSKIKEKVKNLSLKPIKSKKCTSTDPQLLCEKLYSKLNKLDYLKTVSDVYIENQPAFKNPTMKTVSSMLFSYFVFLSIVNNLKINVKFVSPSFKLDINSDLIKFIDEYINDHKTAKRTNCKCRICKLEGEICTNKETNKETYSKYKFCYDSVKELGIIYTKKILHDNNLNNSFDLLKDCDKKDDLCDAFLHGYKRLKK
jgi:hypothetical protein